MITPLIESLDRTFYADNSHCNTEATFLLVAAKVIQSNKNSLKEPESMEDANASSRNWFAEDSAKGKVSATDLARGIRDFRQLLELYQQSEGLDEEEIIIARRDANAILNRNRIEKSKGILNSKRTFVPDDVLEILQAPGISGNEQYVIAKALKRDKQFIEVKIVYPTIRALIIGLRARAEARKASKDEVKPE